MAEVVNGQVTDAVTSVAKKAAIGLNRMLVVIFCVLTIGGIDLYHAYTMEPMEAGTITAITLIGALGGVDVWKNKPKALQ